MKVLIERNNEEKNLDFSGTCKELLEKLEINSEEVLIIKNNELVSLDEPCSNGDEIRLLSVVSGG
jgi:sulfur carrier protein ThiS